MELTRIKSFHPDQMGPLFLGGNLPGETVWYRTWHRAPAVEKARGRRERIAEAAASMARFPRVIISPNDGASFSARLANESRFKIREPDVIRPSVAADFCKVRAFVIRAIDQQAANARRSHFPEGDFLLACRRIGHGRHQSATRGRRQSPRRPSFRWDRRNRRKPAVPVAPQEQPGRATQRARRGSLTRATFRSLC